MNPHAPYRKALPDREGPNYHWHGERRHTHEGGRRSHDHETQDRQRSMKSAPGRCQHYQDRKEHLNKVREKLRRQDPTHPMATRIDGQIAAYDRLIAKHCRTQETT